MDLSTVDVGFHHLIPHHDHPATYGIPSSSSSTLLPDKFPPPPFDPLAVFWHHPPLPLPPQDNQMVAPFPYHLPPAYTYNNTQDDSVPLGGREKRHWYVFLISPTGRPLTIVCEKLSVV
jgi:hypothetical protein